jgi:cyclase
VRVEALGAGEILLTSIDNEGTGRGFDLGLTRAVAESVSIPVIACGGAGQVRHVSEVIDEGKADAVSMASCLHYQYIRHYYSDDDYSTEGNVAFLRSGKAFTKVQGADIAGIKDHLGSLGIPCCKPDWAALHA